MDSKKILSVLKLSGAEIFNEKEFCELDEKRNLVRTICFRIRGFSYVIEWYTNLCTLNIGEVEIKFTDFEFSGTWPNYFKMNLQFNYGKETVCILPVEEYPK